MRLAKLVRDTLDSTPGELIVELDASFPRAVRLRTRLADQLPILQTSDERFDKAFMLSGPEAEVFAIFDGEMRRVLVELMELLRSSAERALEPLRTKAGEHTYIRLIERRLTIRSARPLAERTLKLRNQVQHLVELIGRPMENIAARLLANVTGSDLPVVRNRSLIILLGQFSESPLAKTAARAAMRELPPQLQLVAAIALGAEGATKLRELAVHEFHRAELRAEAFDKYLKLIDDHTGLELAGALLASNNSGPLAERAARAAGALATNSSWTHAVALAVHEGREAIGAQIARGFSESAPEVAERALLALLMRANGAVRTEAIEGLRKRGTLAAVIRLDEAAKRSNAEHKKLARAAIAEIQSRAGPAERGSLSIIGAAQSGGELSLPDRQAGDLSLVEKD